MPQLFTTTYQLDDNMLDVTVTKGNQTKRLMIKVSDFERWLERSDKLLTVDEDGKEGTLTTNQYWDCTHETRVNADLYAYILVQHPDLVFAQKGLVRSIKSLKQVG